MDVRAENHGRPHQKVRFPAAPVVGRNFLTPGHPGVRVRNVREKSGPKSLCLCCFFFPDFFFFTQISGRNFLPELWGEVHPKTAPLQALRCALCSTEQTTFQGGEKGEKVPRKRGEKGWPAKRAKWKKGRVKTAQQMVISSARQGHHLKCLADACHSSDRAYGAKRTMAAPDWLRRTSPLRTWFRQCSHR